MNKLSPVGFGSLRETAAWIEKSEVLRPAGWQGSDICEFEPLTMMHELLVPAITACQESPPIVGEQIAKQLDEQFSRVFMDLVQKNTNVWASVIGSVVEPSVAVTPVNERIVARLGLSLATMFTTASHRESFGNQALPKWALHFQQQLQQTASSCPQERCFEPFDYASQTAEHFLNLQLERAQKAYDISDSSVVFPKNVWEHMSHFSEAARTYYRHSSNDRKALTLARLMVEFPVLREVHCSFPRAMSPLKSARFVGPGFSEKKVARIKVDYVQEAVEIWDRMIQSDMSLNDDVIRFPFKEFVTSLSPSDQKRLLHSQEVDEAWSDTWESWRLMSYRVDHQGVEDDYRDFRKAFKRVSGASLTNHLFDAAMRERPSRFHLSDCNVRTALARVRSERRLGEFNLLQRLNPGVDPARFNCEFSRGVKLKDTEVISRDGRELVISREGLALLKPQLTTHDKPVDLGEATAVRAANSESPTRRASEQNSDRGRSAPTIESKGVQDVIACRESNASEDQMIVLRDGGKAEQDVVRQGESGLGF